MDIESPYFVFYWLDGTKDTAYGNTVLQAFDSLGYGQGAMNGLDYYDLVEVQGRWQWAVDQRVWMKKI